MANEQSTPTLHVFTKNDYEREWLLNDKFLRRMAVDVTWIRKAGIQVLPTRHATPEEAKWYPTPYGDEGGGQVGLVVVRTLEDMGDVREAQEEMMVCGNLQRCATLVNVAKYIPESGSATSYT